MRVAALLRPGRRALAMATAMTVGIGLWAGASAIPASAADPLPAVRYSMDDVSGTTVPDSSGHGLDATLTGSASTVAVGSGSALDLTGGYVDIPAAVVSGATDLTVATRVRWAGGSSWQWLFGIGSDTTRYLFATPSNGDGLLRAAVTRAGGGSNEQTTTGSSSLKAGEWVDLAVTLDTVGHELTTYVNGVALARVASEVSATDLVGSSAPRSGYIGKSLYADPAFLGAIDDFQIFRSALTATQVAALATGPLPTLQQLADDTPELATTMGNPPLLPATLRGVYSDGYDRDVDVAWADVPASAYATAGSFTVSGRAAGRVVTATVTVARGGMTVDLGTDTGAVHGGAAGALYGLYGADMPTSNLIEGVKLKTVATKAQDGAQQPGSDALEILPAMAANGGDVYLRVTDWYRGFPYQWPGSTPAEKLAGYRGVLDAQLDMIKKVPADQRRHLVIEPFNEPEGNMFGTGDWSLDKTSWLTDPTAYFAAWDSTYRRIKEVFPDMRIAGPGTSILFNEVQGFLQHTVAAGTVPDIITWHELSHPQAIRDSVAVYRSWETAAFAGTAYAGRTTPVNINEYAFNYHTSVPGQMIQWISAVEETKINAMIAYWNINGNLSDSVVQSNRANGQWWLYNAYAQLSGHTVAVTPPSPGVNYTLQGVASLDAGRRISRVLLGGASGIAPVDVRHVPAAVFGSKVRVQVREIPWTGQLGDSPQPVVVSDSVVDVKDDAVSVVFGAGDLPRLKESSAYEIMLTPGESAQVSAAKPAWTASYEAENATYTGSGYSKNGPEGSTTNLGNFYTSGGYDVGGLRTGSDGRLTFAVDVPEDGRYDLAVFANSLNTAALVTANGPTNVFVTVDGASEREMFLPLGYKWVVWDHADTTVELTKGRHTITLAANSLDGTQHTAGDAIIDRITLARSAAVGAVTAYEAEYADHDGTVSATGSGTVTLSASQQATFWVYGASDGEAALQVVGSGTGSVALNGDPVLDLAVSATAAVSLQGGVNKIVVRGPAVIDGLLLGASEKKLPSATYQAEDAALRGSAAIMSSARAEGGKAVEGVGGAPGNGNTLTFTVKAASAGRHAVVVRFSNPEQVPATHYNPNPMARHADISVNGGTKRSVLFVPTFNRNNFWERTVVLDLVAGENTIAFSAQEQPNFDGTTYAAQNWPDIPLRADEAPIIDQIRVSAVSATVVESGTVTPTITSTVARNAAGWYRTPVSISFTPGVTGATVEYRTSATGPWRSVSGPVRITTDGITTVSYRAVRGSAVVPGSTASATIKLDQVVPVVSAGRAPATGTGSPRNPVRVSFVATDAGSGVAQVQYRVNGASWQTATSLTLTKVGSQVVSYRATDRAGNASPVRSLTVKIVADPATSVRASKKTVKRGGSVTLRVAGFRRGDDLRVFLGSRATGRLRTDQDGAGQVKIKIAAGAPVGTTTVLVTGSGGLRATTKIKTKK